MLRANSGRQKAVQHMELCVLITGTMRSQHEFPCWIATERREEVTSDSRALGSKLSHIAGGTLIPIPDASFSSYGYWTSVELTRDIVKDIQGVYALEVQGDSLNDALINEGDIVLVQHQQQVENGELAAVWLQDQEETTLKRFYLEGNQVRLQPANPTMSPVFFPANRVEVMGKVVCVIRHLN